MHAIVYLDSKLEIIIMEQGRIEAVISILTTFPILLIKMVKFWWLWGFQIRKGQIKSLIYGVSNYIRRKGALFQVTRQQLLVSASKTASKTPLYSLHFIEISNFLRQLYVGKIPYSFYSRYTEIRLRREASRPPFAPAPKYMNNSVDKPFPYLQDPLMKVGGIKYIIKIYPT